MSESSWSSDEEWTTIAAMVRDTQDNGSNAVEGASRHRKLDTGNIGYKTQKDRQKKQSTKHSELK